MKEPGVKLLKMIRETPSIFNWNKLCKEFRIPYPIIKKNLHRMSKNIVFKYQDLPETFLEKYINDKDLIPIICANQDLSVRFMFKYRNILDWKIMSFYQDIPEPLIRRVIDKVDIDDIVIRQKLSQEFLDEYKDQIDWDYVDSVYCKISNF